MSGGAGTGLQLCQRRLVQALVAAILILIITSIGAEYVGGLLLRGIATSAMALVLHLFLVLAYVFVLARGRARRVLLTGVVCVVASDVASTIALLTEARVLSTDVPLFVWRGLLSWSVLLLVIGSLRSMRPAGAWFLAVRRVAVALAIVVGVIALCADVMPDDTGTRFGSIAIILMVTCVVSLALMSSHARQAERLAETRVDLSCPRCKRRQQILLNGDHCNSCGLRIRIRRA